jgi:glycosyltransferase involved in cell wall biosynthesis
MPGSLNGISVIICCYNSAARLPKTLEHLAWQQMPSSVAWELIIVDNNSSDNTTAIAKKEWEKYRLTVPFKIVTELVPGSIYAKKKGVNESSYDLLLFCDDDNWLGKNYLLYAYEIMMLHTNVAVLGGRSEANTEIEKPFWFDRFQKNYAIGEPLLKSGIANARRYLAGAGMVVRRSALKALDELSFQPMLIGRKGKQLSAGEDSELCLVLLFLGYDLYYDERLKFIHFVSAKKLDWKYCGSMITQSYGSLQIYYDLYYYVNRKLVNNEALSFEEAYKEIFNKNSKLVLNDFNSVKKTVKSIKFFLLSTEGSMKEIKIKANLMRIKYLLLHKQRLRSEFQDIKNFMVHTKEKKMYKQDYV